MINKKSIWFLTLFSLILVLSVYYVTMPSELFLSNNSDYTSKVEEENNPSSDVVDIQESSLLVALRVESEEQMLNELEQLKGVINDVNTSIEDKNAAYDKMKSLNIIRGEEEQIEKQILEMYKLKSFVKINNSQIRIVIDSKQHDTTLANNIMRTVQSNYGNQMYISVKFGG
ncbi:MAG: SpoIIIAH-like family protein [Firmicutes bacterium]|nr:SpoIIIAH-like family protein [Bacillota bacterium]